MALRAGPSLQGFVRISRIIGRAVRAFLVCAALIAGPVLAQAPERVVSMNLCTDQLAMLLAGPGQLVSVSHIALDTRISAMVDEAATYKINHGLAEEIYLMRPDLVVAGTYSDRATLDMLRRLGIPVEVFDPSFTLADVSVRLDEMGAVLHRQEAAQTMREAFERRLAALRAEVKHNPRAVFYYANGYTLDDNTLAGQILLAAGFANAASEIGYGADQNLPLEVLAVTNPDFIITGEPYPGASRSEAILDHPVIQHIRNTRAGSTMADHDWTCGTPYVLRAIETLGAARAGLSEVSQ